jgi:hypothetical protein
MFQQWKTVTMKKTLRPLGGELQQEMLCPFVYIFSILPVERMSNLLVTTRISNVTQNAAAAGNIM